MELCTPQTFSNLLNHRLINPNHAHFQWKPSLLLKKPLKSRFNQGLLYRTGSAIRSASEESSSFTSPYELYVPPKVENKDDGAVQSEAPILDSGKDNETDAYASLIYEPPKVEEVEDIGNGVVQAESAIEEESSSFTSPYELYVPPKVENKDNGAVQSEAPILDSGKDKETDAYASLIYEPPKVEEVEDIGDGVVQAESAIEDSSLDFENKDDGAVQSEAPILDSGKDKETDAYASLIYEPPKVEEVEDIGDGVVQAESAIEDSSLDFDSQVPKLFDKLNIKFDPEDSSSLILFGGAAVTALWLTTAIVGAIDSIPLFPKLLEMVGLGYTVWFSTRYLLFKKNRDELTAKIEELKQEVLGSNYD